MKILMFEWDSFGKEDIEEAFCAEGHDLVLFPVSIDGDLDTSFEIRQRLLAALHQEVPDFVFSVNYFPMVSSICNDEGLRYISWIYDAPYARY